MEENVCILYKNQQWAVTDWGLTSTKPGAPYHYEIAASRLLERGPRRNTLRMAAAVGGEDVD